MKLENSYHSFRESRQIEKILPELGARAHGNTKKVLVRLLNLFQYEVDEAWNSREGQKLLRDKNLLVDDEDDEDEDGTTPAKKPKLVAQDESEEVYISDDDDDDVIMVDKEAIVIDDDDEEEEEEQPEQNFSGGLFVSPEPESSAPPPPPRPKKRTRPTTVTEPTPKPGDGSGGWYNNEGQTDDEAFLALRTRDEYYQEFIDLPRRSKAHFSQSKSALRRLLTYGADTTTPTPTTTTTPTPTSNLPRLSTTPWTSTDLTSPAVLERALELMLRVRLGAKGIATLPFPLIDLSAAPRGRRSHLQRLLAEARHTDQDLDMPGPVTVSARELRETLRGADVAKPLAQIDRDLETQARFGDVEGGAENKGGGGGGGKKVGSGKKGGNVDLTGDEVGDDEGEDGLWG